MLKFTYIKAGIINYGFGLSERNIQLLKQGKPILIDLSELGGDGNVTIFYGKTEQDMGREIAEFIGPETKVHIDPRLGNS